MSVTGRSPSGSQRPAVLFVCTGNAGRSQIAEALLRQRLGEAVRVESAGVAPWPHLHPMAVRLLTERGICLTVHHPKPVAAVETADFDRVVTLGSPARDRLPRAAFGAAYWEHWEVADPADADGTADSEAAFRRALTAIEERLPALAQRLEHAPRLHEWAGAAGIGTGLWATQRLDPARHLPLVQRAGFGAIELNLYKGRKHFDWCDHTAVQRLRAVADDLGLLIWSIHSPDVGRVTSPDPQEGQRQLEALRRCLDLAETLGARAVVSHALLYGQAGAEEEGASDRLGRFLDDLAPQAAASPAQVGFENAGYDCAPGARSAALLARLATSSRAAFGFVLDTGHAHLDGDAPALAGPLADQLVSVHLNDNDGVGDLHLPPGEGSVDWGATRCLLAECGYRGVCLYEIEPGGRDPATLLAATRAAHEAALTAGGATRRTWPARSPRASGPGWTAPR